LTWVVFNLDVGSVAKTPLLTKEGCRRFGGGVVLSANFYRFFGKNLESGDLENHHVILLADDRRAFVRRESFREASERADSRTSFPLKL